MVAILLSRYDTSICFVETFTTIINTIGPIGNDKDHYAKAFL